MPVFQNNINEKAMKQPDPIAHNTAGSLSDSAEEFSPVTQPGTERSLSFSSTDDSGFQTEDSDVSSDSSNKKRKRKVSVPPRQSSKS